MNISIYSILLALGGKCLLNWSLVFLQRHHICRSFLGVFSVSVSAVDTAVTLALAAIHIHDGHVLVLDLRLTTYHTCLLVQILGRVHSALQWPVVIVAALNHLHVIVSQQPATSRVKHRLAFSLVTGLLWSLAALHVFLLSDFVPVLEDVSYHQMHRCWVFHAAQVPQVVVLLSAALCAVCGVRLLHRPPVKDQTMDRRGARSRRRAVRQVLSTFLKTWTPFLLFLAVVLLLPVGMPSYLGLSVAWLCFLNSFLIAVVLCAAGPAWLLARGSAAVPTDSFCEWRFLFSPATGDRTRAYKQVVKDTC